MFKAAGVSSFVLGLGFGLPDVYAVWHLVRTGTIARLLGYPTYGEGYFARHDVETTVPLLLGFLVVCVLECVAGYLLWGEHRSGAVLALALLPAELAYWIGFSLPFGPVLGLLRTALILIGWSAASR